jgi:predicted RNA-binding Zn ribbon-like protein
MADGTWDRLKACAADDCHWAFYDHTRNRSGRWCSMAVCGNRAKVERFRERARDGA